MWLWGDPMLRFMSLSRGAQRMRSRAAFVPTTTALEDRVSLSSVSYVMLNPQPLPPRYLYSSSVSSNPGVTVQLNPQPLPPRVYSVWWG